jgi:hypothetical protein
LCTATKWIALLSVTGLVSACNSTPECLSGADCASGECQANGTCVIFAGSSGGTSGVASGTASGSGGSPGGTSSAAVGSTGGSGEGTSAGGSSAGSSTSAGNGGSSSGGILDAGPNLCAFTGTVTSAQYPVGPGLAATYEVSEDAGFDSTGVPQADGGFLWDMSGQFGNDHAVLVQTEAPSSEWFGSNYPTASYAVTLSDTATDLGVFAVGTTAISLLGVASPSGGAGDTELTYNPAVAVLTFPFQLDSSWSTNSTVSGTLEGVPDAIYTEDYTSQVDKTGTVIVPSGTPFPVLRVRTDLTRTVGLVVLTQTTYAFVTPCFGTVATLVSQFDELQTEFSNPSELERLAAP